MRQARAAPRRGGSERAGTDVPPGAASRAAGADLRLAARHRPAQPGPGLHHLPSHPPHRHHLEAALPGRYRLLGGGVMGSIGVAGEEMGPVGAGPGNILGEGGSLGRRAEGNFGRWEGVMVSRCTVSALGEEGALGCPSGSTGGLEVMRAPFSMCIAAVQAMGRALHRLGLCCCGPVLQFHSSPLPGISVSVCLSPVC